MSFSLHEIWKSILNARSQLNAQSECILFSRRNIIVCTVAFSFHSIPFWCVSTLSDYRLSVDMCVRVCAVLASITFRYGCFLLNSFAFAFGKMISQFFLYDNFCFNIYTHAFCICKIQIVATLLLGAYLHFM